MLLELVSSVPLQGTLMVLVSSMNYKGSLDSKGAYRHLNQVAIVKVKQDPGHFIR